jgi:hypothetical protein
MLKREYDNLQYMVGLTSENLLGEPSTKPQVRGPVKSRLRRSRAAPTLGPSVGCVLKPWLSKTSVSVGAGPFQNTALPPKIVVERITRRLRAVIIVCETIMIL